MPSPPKTIADIDAAFANENVNRLYGQTLHKSNVDKNQFYRTTYVCDEFAYSVFASQRIIDMIASNYSIEERKYMMDATFKVTPQLFYQLLTIHFETPNKQVNALKHDHWIKENLSFFCKWIFHRFYRHSPSFLF